MYTQNPILKQLTGKLVVFLFLFLLIPFLPAEDISLQPDTPVVEGTAGETETITEEDPGYNIYDIFSEDLIDEGTDIVTDKSFSTELEDGLVRQGFIMGGDMASNFTGFFKWNDYIIDGTSYNPDNISMTGFARASLYFDSWRDKDFRVFGKAETYYPYNRPPWGPGVNFRILELFSDFGWKDKIYFRFGKQFLKWGVGRTYNVADVFKTDPGEFVEPEGLFSLKANIPFGNNNLYFYTVLNDEADLYDVSHAAKYEFLIGTLETSLGVNYSYQHPLKAAITLSGSLGDLGLSLEGSASYGSDRNFLNESLEIYKIDDQLFFNADLGIFYRYDDKSLGIDLTFYGQLLYYSEGYSDNTLTANIIQMRKEGDLGLLDVNPLYQYYGSLNIHWTKVLNSDWGMNLFYETNFIDFSGSVDFGLTYPFFTKFIFNTGLSVCYGADNSEVILTRGSRIAASIGLSIGGGEF